MVEKEKEREKIEKERESKRKRKRKNRRGSRGITYLRRVRTDRGEPVCCEG